MRQAYVLPYSLVGYYSCKVRVRLGAPIRVIGSAVLFKYHTLNCKVHVRIGSYIRPIDQVVVT